MYPGDDYYDDELTSPPDIYDPFARADWIRDTLKNSSACFTCKSPDPAIIEGRFCSDCTGEAKAEFQARWAARKAQKGAA